MDGQNAGLMSREKVIDEIADDGIRFVSKFCDHPADQGSAAPVPFKIDCAVKIPAAMNLRPAMRTPRLFGPDLYEVEFLLQLRIAHDL